MKIKSILLSLAAIAMIPALAQARPSAQGQGGQGGDRQGQGGQGGDRPSPEAIFQKIDADGSGGISQEEAKGPLGKNFETADTDSSGEISLDEFKAAAKQARKKGKKGRGGDRFAEMDADQSGGISKEEAGERLLEHFDDIDTDGDGELTKEELKAASQKRRADKGEEGQTV